MSVTITSTNLEDIRDIHLHCAVGRPPAVAPLDLQYSFSDQMPVRHDVAPAFDLKSYTFHHKPGVDNIFFRRNVDWDMRRSTYL
jgi:hypothetical protein